MWVSVGPGAKEGARRNNKVQNAKSLIRYEARVRTYKSLAVSGNQIQKQGPSRSFTRRIRYRHSSKEYTVLKYTGKQDPGDDTGLTLLNSLQTRVVVRLSK